MTERPIDYTFKCYPREVPEFLARMYKEMDEDGQAVEAIHRSEWSGLVCYFVRGVPSGDQQPG